MDQRLAAAGSARTGPPETVRERPWGTVLRAPTDRGVVWLKACGRRTAHEAPLYTVLAEVARARIPEPLGVEPERAWLLLADGGPSVGERLAGEERTAAMCAALARYAQLQRALAPHADRLVALGAPDMRPTVMPRRFEEALDATRPSDAHPRLEAMREQVAAWCERLAAGPVPPSVDHNDLHDRNVLGDGDEPRFYDWGDAVVAHPFASMLVPRSLAAPAEAARLTDAYLAPWRDLAPRAVLDEALDLA